jgi:endonuclease/exonuclease/phosphatase family metal-dependent hydrolase
MSATIGVISQNVLLDHTRSSHDANHPEYIEPQRMRIHSIGETLAALPISPDVVMLQEVQVTRRFHGGEAIAQKLGVDSGFWFPHNTSKRQEEYIGVCGKLVTHAESIQLDFDKLAVITQIAGIAFIGIHLRRTVDPYIKAKQMRDLLDQTSHLPKRVILGDANARPGSEARRLSREAGGKSVYLSKHGAYPATWPTTNYRDVLVKPWQRRFINGGVSIDLFDTIGLEDDEIVRAGTPVDITKADHYTLWGEVKFPPQTWYQI